MSHFRIAFEPKGAFWCIELSIFMGLRWVRVQEQSSASAAAGPAWAVKRFNTFAEAEAYADKIGLPCAYGNRTGTHPVEQYPVQQFQPAVFRSARA